MSETKFTFYEYEITDDGKVFSLSSNWRGYGKRELAQQLNSHGYPSVRLVINGQRKKFLVHKLVAERFLPERPSEHHEIRHLDGDKTNNSASNLAWGTRKENAADRELHGKTSKGESHGMAVLKESDVAELRKSTESHVNLARKYGVTPQAIYAARKYKTWRHINDR